ncbi:toll/interleukin-1 receptor domain-containing protein [Actinoplanes sp. NPDC051851]|uniref:toll/interleukin-1 receptor domain-containing protein n=1 Tax=Actinoplanes sp. NPDC051851 TaxID=3154753 RepID=UPI0034138715
MTVIQEPGKPLGTVRGGTFPPRNPNFSGREDMLAELRRSLTTPDRATVIPHLLHGSGGVGKTQLAAEYAYRYADYYDLIWWIRAEERSVMLRSLAELGRRLDVPQPTAHEQIVAWQATVTLTEAGRRWLLIFDNVDAFADLAGLMPLSGGHVILTGRTQTWPDSWKTIEVDVFEPTESRPLLQQRELVLDDAPEPPRPRPSAEATVPPRRATTIAEQRRKPPTTLGLEPPIEVWVSYKWGGHAEVVVNRLEQAMIKHGLLLRRDKSEMRYRDSISEFKRRLSNGKLVILVLDDAYLRSDHCMSELLGLSEHRDFRKRVFPILLKDAKIFTPEAILGYAQHWRREYEDLDMLMGTVPQDALDGIRDDLKLYGRIVKRITVVLDHLRDMNASAVGGADSEEDFAILIQSIREQHASKQRRRPAQPPLS